MQGHYPDGTPSQMHGYVQFVNEQCASKAIEELNGTEIDCQKVCFVQSYNYSFNYNNCMATYSS